MAKEINIRQGIDWTCIIIYFALVLIGILNVYAAVYNVDNPKPIYSLDHNSGRQILFAFVALILIMVILYVDFKIFDSFAFLFYGIWAVFLFGTIFFGANINGSKSWIRLGGGFNLQPAEFAKTFTVLAVAKYLSSLGVNLKKSKYLIRTTAIVLLPPLLIFLQREAGQALTFSSLIILLYREGLPGIWPVLYISALVLVYVSLVFAPWMVVIFLMLLGVVIWFLFLRRYERNFQNAQKMIGVIVVASVFVMGVGFLVNNVLEKHQANRIKVWADPEVDPRGTGWNVLQSQLAIGSGGVIGKGYLKGTQTKGDFVPEQSTDFIFCTIGEEWGLIGSVLVVGLYFLLFIRIINLAEKQKSKFARIYGYGVVSFMFFHLLANVGMTIGLMPVIGIPLPFISSGGSSLLSFTVLLFIFLKLDAHRSYKV